MGLIVDWEIRSLCNGSEPLLSPFAESTRGEGIISYGLTHAGYDLRLGDELWIFKSTKGKAINPKRFLKEDLTDSVKPETIDGYPNVLVLPPESYALGYSVERFMMPRFLKARCLGKSTLARSGLIVNTTPLEPGWTGHLTIELYNATHSPIFLFAGEGIAQVEFERLKWAPEASYEGKKYQDQKSNPVAAIAG